MKRLFVWIVLCGILRYAAPAQGIYPLASPDGRLKVTVRCDGQLTYEAALDGRQVLAPSALALTLDGERKWGENVRLLRAERQHVERTVPSPFYRASALEEHYNALTLRFRGDYSVEFRAYNDGVAYRFVSRLKKPFRVVDETVEYCFPEDWTASVPYVKTGNDGDFESQFFNSFENEYTVAPLSGLNRGRLMFLPLAVDAGEGLKICLTEAHLEDYPGLYLRATADGGKLSGMFAPCPKQTEQGGHNRLQQIVTGREAFIAKVDAPRSFPWRVAVITATDKELAATNLGYLLGAPSRVEDTSWIKPGKVAWEWWNDWNLEGVDFRTGVNNDTYKAYIDFASKNGIEYVILDEGWAVNGEADLMQVVDEIDLKELLAYAAARRVGIILWAGYHAFERDMEQVCSHYAAMGVKGFKVDFMDRDDQEMTAFNYRAAEMCAKYKLLLDLHGTHKPAGLNRTYPNVLNFEGVNGLEQMKWSPGSLDQMKYDVTLPFIRQVAGPMDYTQGAMRNAARGSYHPCNSEPMSQGTRCHQLALYVVLDSPLNMLCDSPSNYEREPECTGFIAGIPTVWDETRVLEAEMGRYIVTARRQGETWYIGGLTDWDGRQLEISLDFLPEGTDYRMELFTDGANADRKATDYRKRSLPLPADRKLNVKLQPGGGFAARIFVN